MGSLLKLRPMRKGLLTPRKPEQSRANLKSAWSFVGRLNDAQLANRLARPSSVSLFTARRRQFLVSDGRGLIFRFLSGLRESWLRPPWH